MPIYSREPRQPYPPHPHPHGVPFYDFAAPFCDDQLPLHSSVGRGPRGAGVIVDVVDGDPYGYYRIQFKDSLTGEILETTPNLDPGSRVYLCDKNFNVRNDNVYSAYITEFTTEQLGSIRDVRVGDIVLFKANEGELCMFGIGVVNTISNDTVTFTSHINVSVGNIKDSIDNYVDMYVNQQVDMLVDRIDTYLEQQIGRGVDQVEDFKNQIINFAKGVYFGLNTDGYFVAYIPEGWEDITFDTGSDYILDTYGRLILRMVVDGSDNVDQTPEVVRPYTDAELEQKVYNIMQTLYSAG